MTQSSGNDWIDTNNIPGLHPLFRSN